MIIKSSILLLILLFTGCNSYTLVSKEKIQVEIVDIDPPKHFYIYVQTPDGVEKIHISKRCQVKDKLVGSKTEVYRLKYATGDINNPFYYDYDKIYGKYEYCN